MEGHKIAFVADLHGNVQQYQQLADYAISHSIDSVILGGDLCPTYFPPEKRERFIQLQAEFLEDTLPALLSPLKENGIETYLIMGNDDAMANLPILEKHDDELYHIIHSRRLRLADDFWIVGYSYVPLTPFFLKDWDKYDLSKPSDNNRQDYEMRKLLGYRLDGLKSTPAGWKMSHYDEELALEDSIQKDLLRQEFRKSPKKTVYVMHTPPDMTNLDLSFSGHVGSFAVREFIEEAQPYLTLHGHIHETVRLSGNYIEKIGETISLAAGNLNGCGLSLIVLDIYEPENAERIIMPK